MSNWTSGMFAFSVCSCSSLHTGEYCQHPNPCHTGPGPRCQNGGTCNVLTNSTSGSLFTCSCPIGFSASLCEIPVPNSCDSDPCQNGGTCTLVTLKNYTCACGTGFRGKSWDVRADGWCEILDPSSHAITNVSSLFFLITRLASQENIANWLTTALLNHVATVPLVGQWKTLTSASVERDLRDPPVRMTSTNAVAIPVDEDHASTPSDPTGICLVLRNHGLLFFSCTGG